MPTAITTYHTSLTLQCNVLQYFKPSPKRVSKRKPLEQWPGSCLLRLGLPAGPFSLFIVSGPFLNYPTPKRWPFLPLSPKTKALGYWGILVYDPEAEASKCALAVKRSGAGNPEWLTPENLR